MIVGIGKVKRINVVMVGIILMENITPHIVYHFCHKCDNPSCVNPNHLFEGTSKDNNVDCVNKGRHKPNIMKGMNSPNSKLTDFDIIEILALKGNLSGPKVANLYGVTHKVIYDIWKGKAWKHIYEKNIISNSSM